MVLRKENRVFEMSGRGLSGGRAGVGSSIVLSNVYSVEADSDCDPSKKRSPMVSLVGSSA